MKVINTKIPLIGLFLLIAVLSFLLTIYSANIYDDIVKDNGKNDAASLATTYITERLKQTGLQQDVDTYTNSIVIHGENKIDIAIYYYDGYLYETSLYADKELKNGMGEPLFEITGMKLTKSNDMLTISITDTTHEVTKRIRLYDQG